MSEESELIESLKEDIRLLEISNDNLIKRIETLLETIGEYHNDRSSNTGKNKQKPTMLPIQ